MLRSVRLPAIVLIAALFVSPRFSHAEIERLDPRVTPVSQAIELSLDASRIDYHGRTSIKVDVSERTDQFSFHAEEMTLDQVVLRGGSGAIPLIIERGRAGIVKVTTRRPVSPGMYTLEIDFSHEYGTKAVGLYRMEHDGAGYLFSQFEAVDARKAFPCWDEPCFKIRYDMTVHIPSNQEVVFNTPVQSESRAGDVRTVVFETTMPMPTYLLAVAAGPLESVPIPGLSVPGRVYTVAGQSHLTGLAGEMAPPILGAMEDYFGRPYPYRKLDLLAVPEYWPGAMENPGAITFSDGILLVDPDAASVWQRRTLARVMAHEFAHMWFGDLVTMAWWDDLWLNESFADWLGDKVAHKTFPELDLEVNELQAVQGIFDVDARPSTPAIRQPIESESEMMRNVGVAYLKGKTALTMVEHWIGEGEFRRGIISYVNENEWGNTVAADLWGALRAVSGEDVAGVLATFIDQPGFPLVTVERADEGAIRISQERFRNFGVDVPEQIWKFPLQMKYHDGSKVHTTTVVLDRPSMEIDLEGPVEWVHPDAEARGYYRWRIPREMSTSMLTTVQENLDTRERAALFGNMSSLLRAGHVGADEVLELCRVSAANGYPATVSAALGQIASIYDACISEDLKPRFAGYIRATFGPALARIGPDPQPGEPEAVRAIRPRLFAWLGILGADGDVVDSMRDLAHLYIEDKSSVDPGLAGAALNVTAHYGGLAEFDLFREQFETATVPAVRSRFLRAIGRFDDPDIQDAALRYALEGPVRTQEVRTITMGIGKDEPGSARVYDFVIDHYEVMAKMVPEATRTYFPYFAGGCSLARVEHAREFFMHEDRYVPGMESSLEQIEDSVADCARLRDREGRSVADYLNRFAPVTIDGIASGEAGGKLPPR